MRLIKVIFLSLLALSLILCAVVFIFFETFDADQYLSQITRKASLEIGRPVSIGRLGLGLSLQGITLDALALTVADDPGFTSQPFIKIDRVRISLDLKSFLFQRQIRITGILLQSPQIHFIRSQEGNINVRSLGQPNRSADNNTVVMVPDNKAQRPILLESKDEKNKELSSDIEFIKIQDASISFIDQSQDRPLDVWLRHVNASLKDFSISEPFLFSFDGSPLVFKSMYPQMPDNPIFKNITIGMQLNLAHLDGVHFADIGIDKGDILITDGTIKNFNIIKTVLSRTLGALGSLDGLIDKLGVDDTVIEKAQVKFSFHDKKLFIDDSLLQTNMLEFTAKGSMDQGLNMDMETMLHLNDDVSATLVNEMGGLKYLMDDSKRLSIGASLKGVIPRLKYKPNKDFKKKSRKVFMEEGASILGIFLGGR